MDDDPVTHNIMKDLLKETSAILIPAQTPMEAVGSINTVHPPFSIIIAEQDLSGSTMQGTDVLELAQQSTPNSLRFLLTAQMKLDTLLAAVNKGAIQRAIPKPIDPEELKEALHLSLLRYERFLEKERLFSLAKQQSIQLYLLNKELMDAAQTHNTLLEKLSQELKSMGTPGPAPKEEPSPNTIQQIMDAVEIPSKHRQQVLNHLYSKTLVELFSNMENLAHRNGLELPETLLPEGLNAPD